METNIESMLRQERGKLEQLVDEALQNGTPIDKTAEIMDQCKKIKRLTGDALQGSAVCAQSRRVDELIERVERERGRAGG
jgi:hypothetical protein